MADALNLLHLVNVRSANVGNGALTEGVESLLQEDLAQDVRFMRVPWDDYTFGLKAFDRDFVSLINDTSDGMIVGGAVTMNGQPHYANTGMRFDLPLEMWASIRRPLVFYGISYRHWTGQPYSHVEKLKAAISYALDHDRILLGVRNDGTLEWMASTLGIESDRIHIVADPGVFAQADAGGTYPELMPDRRNVILAFNDEDADARFGGPEGRIAVIKEIAAAMERVLKRDDVNLILAPHYFDDNRMLADFISLSKPQLAHQRMISIGSARTSGARHFYGRYVAADLAISMRVHSMSPCVGLGVPMVPLTTQGRMSRFLEDVGLGDLMIDGKAPDLAERLAVAVERGLDNPDVLRARFAQARAGMRQRNKVFNRKVADLLGRQ